MSGGKNDTLAWRRRSFCEPRNGEVEPPGTVSARRGGEAAALPALTLAFSEGGLAGVRHLDPFRIGRGVRDVAVVPVPPFVRPALWSARGRIFPLFLTSERGDVEVAP